ncbi:MAG: hypothetical protein QOD93_6089 [Acetobacteraceae bacterium]|nr:hypothetical protein [Acetobacteraceae bacterium]
MHIPSRRRAMTLASSFAAAFPFLTSGRGRAQVKPGAVVFEMADFPKNVPDPDAAFANALAAIAKATGDANKAGKPVPIVLNLENNATYKIKRPLPSNSSAPSNSMETALGLSIRRSDRRC